MTTIEAPSFAQESHNSPEDFDPYPHIKILQSKDATAPKRDKAFEELYAAYYLDLLRYSTYILGSEELAEDAVQEAFIKLYTKIELYRVSEGHDFQAWLTRTLRNTAIDIVRRRKVIGVSLDKFVDYPSPVHDPSEVAIANEQIANLKLCPTTMGEFL